MNLAFSRNLLLGLSCAFVLDVWERTLSQPFIVSEEKIEPQTLPTLLVKSDPSLNMSALRSHLR